MEEFFIADSEAVGGRKNLIMMVLKDKLKPHELTRELRTYMKTYTYICSPSGSGVTAGAIAKFLKFFLMAAQG